MKEVIVALREKWADVLKKRNLIPIPVDQMKERGRMDECGRPGKKDAAYTYRKDGHGECLYVHNFHNHDEFRLQTSKERAGSNCAKEREEFYQKGKEEINVLYAEAAQQAGSLMEQGEPASDDHPYLIKKQLPASPDLKVNENGELMIPIYDADGALISIQFIASDGHKKNLPGGRLKGGRYIFDSMDGNNSKRIIIAEGWATGASIHASTGAMTVVVFGCDNITPVVDTLIDLTRGTQLIIAADNDCDNETNPGVKAALEAAMKYGAIVAIPDAIAGESTDFSDVYLQHGPDVVAQQIREAERKYSFSAMPEGFMAKHEAGSWKLKYITDKQEITLCDMIHVSKLGREKDGFGWMYFLEFCDRDGRYKTIAINAELLSGDKSEWLTELASAGLHVISGHKPLIGQYLTSCEPKSRVSIVRRTGWTDNTFITSSKTYNQPSDAEPYYLVTSSNDATSRKGTLKGWQEKLGRLLHGNLMCLFAVTSALAGPLLKFTSVGSGGFHFFGDSSCGKTTLIRLASSVWGAPQDMIRTWRATDNGLEGVAESRNDLLLCLDEIHQADTAKVASIIYMLGNEMGKQRANRSGQARRLHSWRLMILSSGEKSVEGKLHELGKEFSAGQEVRLPSLPVKREDIQALHGFSDSASLTQAIEQYASEEYGTLGDAFLDALTASIEDVQRDLPDLLDATVNILLKPYPNSSSQVMRVARRFALCCCAGMYAAGWELIPVTKDDVMKSILTAFHSWVEERGGCEPNEKMRVLALVRNFIEAHAHSRFYSSSNDERSIHNCAGLVCIDSGSTVYAFYTGVFANEVLKGYPVRKACSYLKEEGWLIHEEGKNTKKRLDHDGTRKHMYHIELPDEYSDSNDAPAADPDDYRGLGKTDLGFIL